MWKFNRKKLSNYPGIVPIVYRCTDEDLGIKKVSRKKERQKAYHQIFQEQATINMQDRLDNFSQFQSQFKQ